MFELGGSRLLEVVKLTRAEEMVSNEGNSSDDEQLMLDDRLYQNAQWR